MASSKRNRGFKKIVGQKGKLHRALGVPEDQPIPPGKKRAALSGSKGPAVKAMANRAFRGVLKAGRQTVARNKARRRKSGAAKPPARPPMHTARVTNSMMNQMSSSQLYSLSEKRAAARRRRRGQ